MSRTKSSLQNALTGTFGSIVKMGVRFFTKTAFIYILGAEYVGLQGLLQNIVGFLNITELGLGTAIVFSLYKVIADADEQHIAAIMHLFKKLYRYIGFVILVLSIIIAPFMPILVKDMSDFPDFWIIYALYIVDSLLTYWFFSYRNSILQADQKQYVTNLINLGIDVTSSILQFILLYFSHSFSLFLIGGIICKIYGNIYLKCKTDKMYPYLLMKNYSQVPPEMIQEIKTNVKAIVIYNGGYRLTVVLDTMLISYYLDIVTVGRYGNYLLIFNAFTTLMTAFFTAFTASIGNLRLKADEIKNEFIFRCLNMVDFSLSGLVGLVTSVSLGSFIVLWIGDFYVFDPITHYVLIFQFSTDLLGAVVLQYRNAYGLFDKGKYRPLFGDLLNVIFAVVLAPKFGVIGIVLSRLAASYLTFWWFDSWLIYHYGFHMSVWRYYRQYIFDLICITLFTTAVVAGIQFTNIPLSWFTLIGETLLAIVLATFGIYLRYGKTEEFQFIKNRFITVVQNKRGK